VPELQNRWWRKLPRFSRSSEELRTVAGDRSFQANVRKHGVNPEVQEEGAPSLNQISRQVQESVRLPVRR